MQTSEVLLGLGANLGNPIAQLETAVARLSHFVRLDAVSSVYRTEPVGYRDQPEFFNLVCRGRTALEPLALLGATQRVENGLGRERSFANAPRTIDIDLLAYDQLLLQTEVLILPHPRLHLRAFVLTPLAEIAPDWRHPRLGMTARELQVATPTLERIAHWGALPGWG